VKHVRQIIESNKGIVDIVGDDSLTHKGFKYHSSFDFTVDKLDKFCNVIRLLEAECGGDTVIELGCGSSVMATCLKEETSYLGLDGNPDAGMYVKGMNKENKHVIVVDFTKEFMLEPTVKADLLISFDVFEHLPEEKIDFVIKQVSRLLKPNGLAFFIIDRLPLQEHITIRDLSWWQNKFETINKWRRIESESFMQVLRENPCGHWVQNIQWHNYLLYRGDGNGLF